MQYLLWYDQNGTLAERAARAVRAYLAKTGKWPQAVHTNPSHLPAGPQTIDVDGHQVRILPAHNALRDHLQVEEAQALAVGEAS